MTHKLVQTTVYILTKYDNLETVVLAALETSICLEDCLFMGHF